MFACDSCQQQVQLCAEYPLFDSQSDREYTFLPMRFHAKYPPFDSQSDLQFSLSSLILAYTLEPTGRNTPEYHSLDQMH